MKKSYEISYNGYATKFKDRKYYAEAENKRQAVGKVYSSLMDRNYFPQEDDSIFDADGNLIAVSNDDTIYYDGGYFTAEEIACEKLDFKTVQRYKYPNYIVDCDLEFLKEKIARWVKVHNLDLNPEFQRDHVWTEKQQIEFMEFFLSGGYVTPLCLNMEGWMRDFGGVFQLIDGKQRLNAIFKFINDELPVFGGYTINKLENFHLRRFNIKLAVNDLPETEAIDWYISMNTGGTMHTDEEITKAIKYRDSLNKNVLNVQNQI